MQVDNLQTEEVSKNETKLPPEVAQYVSYNRKTLLRLASASLKAAAVAAATAASTGTVHGISQETNPHSESMPNAGSSKREIATIVEENVDPTDGAQASRSGAQSNVSEQGNLASNAAIAAAGAALAVIKK